MSNSVGKVFNVGGGGGSGGGTLKLESLTITNPPKKQTYKSGEQFDPDGMVVTAGYGYGITTPVTGYTYSPQTLTDGVKEVIITYTEGRVTKTASVSVTVEKVLRSIAVTKDPTTTEYDYLGTFNPAGMVVTATYSDGSEAPVDGYTYSKTPFTTLGKQPVNIEYTYEGVAKSTTYTVTVKAIQVAVPTQKNPPRYDGTPKTPEWNGYDEIKMSTSGDKNGTLAKTYEIIFTLSYGYTFPGGQSTATVEWVIKRGIVAAVPTQSNTLVADGSPKTPTWNGYDPAKLTQGGELTATEAGEHTATFTPTVNYEWFDESTGPKNAVWTIISVLVTIPSQINIPVYSGAQKTPEWKDYDSVHSTVKVTPQTNAGEYDAVFTLTEGMWTDKTTAAKTIKWKIERATIAAVPKQSGTPVYDGNPKSPSWDTTYDQSKMTVSVEPQINAGTAYTASFTPTVNYKWFDGETTAKTATWSIAKANQTVTVTPQSITLNMSSKSVKFTVNRKGDGVISAQSGAAGIATIGGINQNSGEVTVNSVNNTSGSTEITVNVAAGTNYLAGTAVKVSVKATFREYLYGYDLKISDSNPTTRVTYPSDVENSAFAAAKMNFGASFSYGGWPSTPGQKFMPRPCMLKSNGVVDYYLDPTDYTKKAGGGTSDVKNTSYDGNAMMEWPKIFVRRWEENGTYHFRCSDIKVDSNYECWSNYDKNNKEIPHFYTPIYFGSKDSGGKMRSLSGQNNWVNTGGAQPEIDAAKLNGADIWFTEVFADRQLINDLLTMMFKSTDLQTAAGSGRTKSSNSNAIQPGTMDTSGLFWGSNDGTSGVKVFGMENWWGNLWRRTAGWIAKSGKQWVKATRGTKDGTTVADYNTDGSGYLDTGITVTSSNYISKMATKPYGRIPSEVSGSSSTYEADYAYNTSSSGPYYALCGATWDDGLDAGPFYVYLRDAPTISYSDDGAALSCKPLAA